MCGLALGSFAAARLKRSNVHPLLIYGLLEAFIGVYSIFTPEIAVSIEQIYAAQFTVLAGNFLAGVSFKAFFSACLLLLPTFAMGATLPILVRIFAPAERQRNAAWLYGINTAGAVVGTLLSGYLLLPMLGISRTIYLTAAGNIVLAAIAIVLGRRPTGSQESTSSAAPVFHPYYLLLFSTGFAALSYEILWTRALGMFFGSSVYAFSAILAAFLLGIASGSSYYARRIPETMQPLQFFSLLQMRMALSGVFFIGVFMGLPVILIWLFRVFYSSFPLFQISQFLLITAAVFYTTFLSGAAFPAGLNLFRSQPERLQSFAGQLYTYNTIGSILGSLFAGFIFIPLIGVERAIRLVIYLNLVVGLVCYLATPASGRKKQMLAVCGVTAILAVVIPSWNKSIYNSGFYAFAYKYVPQEEITTPIHPLPPSSHLKQNRIIAAGIIPDVKPSEGSELKLIYYAEGLTATVAVVEENAVRSLLINGKPDASNVPTGDMRTQLLLGHLPVLLHGNPQDALVIGLGSGVTAGALSTHGLKRIDCVEIEKKVVGAARFYSKENLGILDKKEFHLVIDDGRNVVQHTPYRYDIITSEPSNLWMSGVANLFTQEFFRAAAKRLRTHGIMCQWIHLYQISLEDVLIFLKTFHSVFPHLSIWIDGSDMLVLGSDHPLFLSPDEYHQRMSLPQVERSMQIAGLTLSELSRRYVSDERILKPLKKNVPLNTDDHPILEFSAARSIFLNQSIEIAQSLYILRGLAER